MGTGFGNKLSVPQMNSIKITNSRNQWRVITITLFGLR
jgi:hypothetical protein